MSDIQKLLSLWEEVKVTIETTEVDMYKNTRGNNVSAGVSLRKNMRILRKALADCVRESSVLDKQRKQERKQQREKDIERKAAEKAAETAVVPQV